MKRYHFTLEAVLRFRRAEEEQARDEFHLANTTLRMLLLRRDQLIESYGELSRCIGVMSFESFGAERQAAELAAQKIQHADLQVAEQAATAALAQVAYRAATARVEALNRLDARQRAEHAAQEQRAVNTLLDELVTARYVRDNADRLNRPSHV